MITAITLLAGGYTELLHITRTWGVKTEARLETTFEPINYHAPNSRYLVAITFRSLQAMNRVTTHFHHACNWKTTQTSLFRFFFFSFYKLTLLCPINLLIAATSKLASCNSTHSSFLPALFGWHQINLEIFLHLNTFVTLHTE